MNRYLVTAVVVVYAESQVEAMEIIESSRVPNPEPFRSTQFEVTNIKAAHESEND